MFLAVFQGLARFDGGEAGFRSWVFTIAHRRLIDVRRRMARRPWSETADGELPDRQGGDVEQDAFAVIGSRQVQQWCSALPDAQREVLLLRVVGDLTVEQVAATVGRSPGAVKALQRRALAALRRRLEHEGVTL